MASRKTARVLATMIMAMVGMLPAVAGADDPDRHDFYYRHFVGGRFGTWINSGDTRPVIQSRYDAEELSSSSLYGEFFYSHRFLPALALEINLGIYSRGEIRYFDDIDTYLGKVNLYPIILSAKIYPLAFIKRTMFHPYLQIGGGLFYGKRDQIDYFNYIWLEDSETRISFALGGGVDLPVADQISLTTNVRYTPIKFGEPLAEYEDYSGWQITVGVGYIFKN
ncbi:MAG: outer membrane beta-barrel protein [Candidatus Zixiibacteriota bacterium]|nr:MAG: outer membrane beta-barrel protein [candidate division Zixibacteria bacterium]